LRRQLAKVNEIREEALANSVGGEELSDIAAWFDLDVPSYKEEIASWQPVVLTRSA
jgi:hypothetical protein